MRFVLFDIDHTLMNSSWRDVMLPPNGTWDEYHEASSDDKPHLNCIDLCRHLTESNYACIGITMRPEKWRTLTNQTCLKFKIPLLYTLMRDTRDFSPVIETKIGLIQEYFNEVQRKDIAFYIDDREDICQAVTNQFGITSLQVRHRIHN